MSLENLKSIFENELQEKVELFKENQPIDRFDTKLNYNENPFNESTFTFSADLTQRGGRDNPLLDSVLRGRVYNPIRFSQDFENNNLFVKPETGEITEQLFKDQTFDPRAPFAKEGTLYFNTNNSFNPATNPTDFSTAIGNNDLPYTPLTELGGQFKENLSWENLYNSNHSLKDNPSFKDVDPIPDPDNSDLLTIKFSHLEIVFCFETNLLLLIAAVNSAVPFGNPEIVTVLRLLETVTWESKRVIGTSFTSKK